MSINLSKYVGKRVKVTYSDGSSSDAALMQCHSESNPQYPFRFDGKNYTVDGRWHVLWSDYMDIIKIEELDDISTPTKELPMSTKEDHIKALEAMGFSVTLTPRINIDWSKEPAWVEGYLVDVGERHYVVFGDISNLRWVSDSSGWNFVCACLCIPKEASPIKDYKGHPKDSLHLRPSDTKETP